MHRGSPTYDSPTNLMEFAPGLTQSGDPAVGQAVTRYTAWQGTGAEAVVNSTATDTTYTNQAVLYGPTPASGAALTAGNFFWTCPLPFTLTGSRCVSGTINNQATLVLAPAGSTAFDAVADKVLYGSVVPQGSALTANTVKFVDTVGNGVYNPGSFTAISAGVQAADIFGINAFTIETFTQTSQFGYLNNGWIRVDNSVGSGLPGLFTWLNAWNPSPVAPGTIRQGFKSTTTSMSPFIDSTLWDGFMVSQIYANLALSTPLSGAQLVNWMALSEQQLPNSALTYAPPAGTTSTFRFTLRSDMFFQDGRKVTSFDVAFSYLALKGTGAFLSGGEAPMTRITILGPTQVDINVKAFGPFTLISLTDTPEPIMPGAYWSNAGSSAFTSGVSTCTATGAACYPAQYSLGTPSTTTVCALTCAFPASLMNVNAAQTGASYDPITAHTLVGSAAWECGAVTSSGSGSCSSSGTMNPPVGGSYVLSRFGKGVSPASRVSGSYFC